MSILLAFFLIMAIAGATASVVILRALGQPLGEEYIATKPLVTYAAIACVGLFLLGVFL